MTTGRIPAANRLQYLGATRRRRRGSGAWRRWLGPLSRKKIIFCPQNYSFGCTLMQFLTGRKWIFTRSLGTRILRFNLEMMLTQRCKNYPEIHGQTEGGAVAQAQCPPPFNTPLEAGTLVRILIRYQFRALGYGQFTRTLCRLLG